MANNREKGYGLTAETTKKLEAKYDPQSEKEAVQWINAVLGGTELGNVSGRQAVQDKLRDGIILCKLMNTLRPGAIPKIHPANANKFKHMENIANFLNEAEKYGVARGDLFQSVYLTDSNQNMSAVIGGIHALGRKAQTNGFKGPVLGPKEATANPREFTEEQLLEGRVRGI